MKILINSPSLDPQINVSGISSVTSSIIKNNKLHSYVHMEIGKPDTESRYHKKINRVISYYILWFKLLNTKIDLIHFNLPLGNLALIRDYPMILLARLKQKKIILHIHGGELLFKDNKVSVKNYIMGKIFTGNLPTLVLSSIEKDQLISKYKSSNITILPNAIDITESAKYSNDNNDFSNILFMGRLHKSKGIEDIIEAFRILNKINDKYHFYLCGQGPEKDNVVNELTSLLGNRFIYKGVVSGMDKILMLKENGIFLLPSRYGEGLPVALLEAMSFGLIPIVTNDASMTSIVKNNINGFVISKNDPEAIANKINEIMDNREMALKLSREAKREIEINYNINEYISKLNLFYQEVK